MRCMLHELLAAKILSPRYQIDAEMVWKAVQTELILGETHWSKCQRGNRGTARRLPIGPTFGCPTYLPPRWQHDGGGTYGALTDPMELVKQR
jgi:hypothetical protein